RFGPQDPDRDRGADDGQLELRDRGPEHRRDPRSGRHRAQVRRRFDQAAALGRPRQRQLGDLHRRAQLPAHRGLDRPRRQDHARYPDRAPLPPRRRRLRRAARLGMVRLVHPDRHADRGALTMPRLGLGDLIGAGPRAVSRYTGTLLTVFVVQSLIAASCIVAIAGVFASTFSHLPMFDEAVDGDFVALFYAVRYGKDSMIAPAGIVFGAVMLWQLASWFVVGGACSVFAQRPEGRGDTARCFGAGGASTYLAYARLGLCALPGWIVVLSLLGFSLGLPGFGAGLVKGRIEHALTLTELLGPLAVAVLPPALLLHVLWPVEDYARVELTLRHDTHDPGVVATYLRSLSYVLRRPVTLVHAALGWLVFALVSLAYFYLSLGHPMYGAEGAITLF